MQYVGPVKRQRPPFIWLPVPPSRTNIMQLVLLRPDASKRRTLKYVGLVSVRTKDVFFFFFGINAEFLETSVHICGP